MPINDAEVRLAFFKEVGQQADFQAVLEHDLIGANARAKRIDERRTKESPSETGKRAASRIATAILMYSFGGLRRDGANGTEFLPPGITEADLLSVCVGPDLDSTTALACLKELKEQCLYLHFDGVRYCFKKDQRHPADRAGVQRGCTRWTPSGRAHSGDAGVAGNRARRGEG